MAHIASLAFFGIRRLNVFKIKPRETFLDWRTRENTYFFGDVNIFIGANGGGKSTVIDLVDSVRNPLRLVTLPRENQRRDSLSAFKFVFSDSSVMLCQTAPNEIKGTPRAKNIQSESTDGLDIQHINVTCISREGVSYSLGRNISKVNVDPEYESELRDIQCGIDLNINYWSESHRVEVDSLCRILNRAAPHLPGVLSLSSFDSDDSFASGLEYKRRNPFRPHDSDRVAVWLSDDSRQSNHIHIASLPAGWRRLASIIDWLENCKRGSVCLIEEPETHLHPTLQRHLAHEIDCYVKDRGLQIFIATHSTVFQQMAIWKNSSRIFDADSQRLVEYSDALGLLDRLGIKASDVSQSNGVIWVEGASDRLYIKHWLELWCKVRKVSPPVENVDYSFCFYGGSLLSHFSLEEQNGFVKMLGLNRNCAIVIDQDFDFEEKNGSLFCKSLNSAKSRILEEFSRRRGAFVWVTEGYTIECYLPSDFFAKNFIVDERNAVRAKSQKVNIANKYIENFDEFESCSSSLKLGAHMERLFFTIQNWNHVAGESMDMSCKFLEQ